MAWQDAYIFTHYTEYMEAKQRDVRRLQAETTRSFLRRIGAAIGRALGWVQRDDGAPRLNQR